MSDDCGYYYFMCYCTNKILNYVELNELKGEKIENVEKRYIGRVKAKYFSGLYGEIYIVLKEDIIQVLTVSGVIISAKRFLNVLPNRALHENNLKVEEIKGEFICGNINVSTNIVYSIYKI